MTGAETIRVECDRCGGVHVASYSHEGRFGQGAIFEAACEVDGLSVFHTREAAIDTPPVTAPGASTWTLFDGTVMRTGDGGEAEVVVSFRVSGVAMGTMEGSEITSDPVAYDGGTVGARDAVRDLRNSTGRKLGKGRTFSVTTTRAGAECILDYCQTVGSTFSEESDVEVRREGRALLAVADRIRAALGG